MRNRNNKKLGGTWLGFVVCGWLVLLTGLPSMGQNIIPNPGYELLSDYSCPDNPIVGFDAVESWYRVDGVTPYLFIDGCRYDQTIWRFYNPSASAASGFNVVNLIGVLLTEGAYGSVPIAVPLTQPLEAGREYYVQFDTRNSGVWHRIDDSLRVCETDPPKRIQITFGGANILENGVADIRNPDLIFTDPVLQSPEPSDWIQLHTCMTATSAQTHLALSLNQGPSLMSAPCEIRTFDQDPIYFNFNFDFDNWVLYPIPERIDTTLRICDNPDFAFDLQDLARIPREIPVSYSWADGFVGSTRTFRDYGVYEALVELPCSSFPIRIEILQEDCLPQIYVPTAFSPDGDGVNDEFYPFIRSPLPVQYYQLEVYDRWGGLVFRSENPEERWDGWSRGSLLAPGVYLWRLQLELGKEGATSLIQQQGQFTLLR